MNHTPADLGLLQAMQIYFQGEKTEALVFILPVGLLSLVFSAWLLTDHPTHFVRGVALPFVLMGVLMTSVGAVVGYRTPGQAQALEHSLQTQGTTSLQTETERMGKVNKAWSIYLAIWGVLGALGLVLRFATASDFLQGLGIALVFFSGVGLLVDGFAERRAQPYTAALHAQR